MSKKKKLKPLTNKEYYQLAQKVDSEGFGYYMFHYGPDMKVIERLGFDIKKVEEAIEVLAELEEKIFKGLEVDLTDEELDELY